MRTWPALIDVETQPPRVIAAASKKTSHRPTREIIQGLFDVWSAGASLSESAGQSRLACLPTPANPAQMPSQAGRKNASTRPLSWC